MAFLETNEIILEEKTLDEYILSSRRGWTSWAETSNPRGRLTRSEGAFARGTDLDQESQQF